jgi:hypothetical protein
MVAAATQTRINPTTANLACVDEWLDRLADQVDAAAQGEELTRYLQSLSRFWRYSSRNCWLIAAQMPTATRVASRKTWESLSRRIKRDHWKQSLQILCPHFRKVKDQETGEEREELTHFSTGYVYDVSATEGEPLASFPWHSAGGDYTALYDALLLQVRRSGLTVEVHDDLAEGVQGYSTGKGTIVINSAESLGNQCATLLHELAHERCHGILARTTFTRQMLECQAECIAFCACQALRIPAPNTPNYLALYRIDRAQIIANLEAIRAGLSRIMRDIERVVESATIAA